MPGRKGRGRPRKQPVSHTSQKASRAIVTPSSFSSRFTESYTSLLMGVVVVIVAVLFVVSFIRQTHHIQDTSSIATAITPTAIQQTPSEFKPAHSNKKTYTVQAGDDLWHIAEKFYKSGYNWVDIAKANNLADPSTIHSGNVLVLPSVTPEVATITVTPTPAAVAKAMQPSQTAITGTTYTVQSGDDLWNIAVRAYADGYKWVDIAQANNLADPSLIFSGNVLKIPRS